MIGDIMVISRLRMGTDGKGVCTLAAFFGCPLHANTASIVFVMRRIGLKTTFPEEHILLSS